MQTEGLNNNIFLLVLFSSTFYELASSLATSFLKLSLQPSVPSSGSSPHKSLLHSNLGLKMPQGRQHFPECCTVILESRALIQDMWIAAQQ